MKNFLLFFTVAYSCLSYGQSFQWKTSIGKVEESGFYSVLPGLAVTTHLKEDFSDIRIFNKKGLEQPYLLRQEIPSSKTRLFRAYEIIEKEYNKGCCTYLKFHNPQKTKINNVSLIIKNAQVSKKATLTGSDDQQNWFVIRESILFNSINNSRETSEIKIVDFPLTDYKFYSLTINDSSSAPLNIVSAGYYDTYSETGKYTNIPIRFEKTDSLKQTRINISLESPQFIDKVEFSVQGTSSFFLRNAKLFEKKVNIIKGKNTVSFNLLREIQLTSFNPNVFNIPTLKSRQLYLIIENEDNPPLEVNDVKVYQLNRYLDTYLKNGEEYVLMFGNSSLQQPVYDLAYFKDSISTTATIINTGNIVAIDKKVAAASSVFFSNKVIVWIAVIAVVLLLAIMSISLLRNIKPVEEN